MTMRHHLIITTIALACVSLLQAEPKATGRPITIKAVDGLQFDPPQARMKPGQTVLFRFLNRDSNDMPHNLVIIKEGALEEIQKASMQITPEAIARGYVPDHEAVIKGSKLIKADEGDEFYFTAPEEKGVYHYVCTYPGHSSIMYGALYVGKGAPKLHTDKNVPQVVRNQALELENAKKNVARPFMRRYFMTNAGPAAIGVALPGDQNYCWDAGNCRLRYAWTGDFINYGSTSRTNGSRQVSPSGKIYWNGGGDNLTYTISTGDDSLKPDFKGYQLINGTPKYTYHFGELVVTEFPQTQDKALVNTISVQNASAPIKVYAKGNVTSNVGTREGDYIVVNPADAQNIQLTFPAQ